MVLRGCEATVVELHERVKVVSHTGVLKVRTAPSIVWGVVTDNVFFYNNSVSVVLRALRERLYLVKGKDGFVPCPKPTASFSSLSYILKRIRRQLPSFPPVWTDEQFVQSYTGSKRARYESAVANLARRGLRRQDGYLKTFIKAELYNGTLKRNPCPRLIQPRSAEYNVRLGVYIRPLEKLTYKAIDRLYGHHVVLKCDNMVQRAETITQYWSEFRDPVYVGLDASRFDQHVSEQALQFEHSFYTSIHRSDELSELLSWQVKQKGYANMCDGTVKYSVDGCRASGDMNTALGNVLLMCTMAYDFLSKLPCKWRFINDGDDCGIFIERSHLSHLDGVPSHFLQYGFEMEVEHPVSSLEKVEFCQCQPVHLGNNNWMMVRNIHKAMKHDWISLTSRNYATHDENLHATGVCGLALYADVPVLGSMYAAMARFPARTKTIGRILSDEQSGLGRTWRMFASSMREFPVDETAARVSIYRAFGLLPDEQVALEEQFRAFDCRNLSYKIPVLSGPEYCNQYFQDG